MLTEHSKLLWEHRHLQLGVSQESESARSHPAGGPVHQWSSSNSIAKPASVCTTFMKPSQKTTMTSSTWSTRVNASKRHSDCFLNPAGSEEILVCDSIGGDHRSVLVPKSCWPKEHWIQRRALFGQSPQYIRWRPWCCFLRPQTPERGGSEIGGFTRGAHAIPVMKGPYHLMPLERLCLGPILLQAARVSLWLWYSTWRRGIFTGAKEDLGTHVPLTEMHSSGSFVSFRDNITHVGGASIVHSPSEERVRLCSQFQVCKGSGKTLASGKRNLDTSGVGTNALCNQYVDLRYCHSCRKELADTGTRVSAHPVPLTPPTFSEIC